jgi:hypothetical protein
LDDPSADARYTLDLSDGDAVSFPELIDELIPYRDVHLLQIGRSFNFTML